MSEPALWDWIKTQGPFAALLAAILVAGARKVWVWGWLYKEKEAQAARWERIALRALGVAETTAGELLKKP